MRKLAFKTILSAFALLVANPLCAAEEKKPSTLEINKVSSGIAYPTKGDESLKIKHGELTYHAKVLHPKVLDGPHFSTPFFWATKKGEFNVFEGLVTWKTHIGGLDWLSLNNGYFFTEKKGKLRGFFFEDGFDNYDNGSSGLIVIFKDQLPIVWKWEYDRDPNKPKGHYIITDINDPKKAAPAALFKQLDEVLKLAEKEADAWPGP